MSDPLAHLLAEGVIEEVISRLKSGKEADIYLVQHAGEIVAAKIYKERHARNFHNNSAYREGRVVRNSRTQRAMNKGSRFGQQAAEDAWKSAESDALEKLYTAGLRVPQPVMFYEGVLLMEVVLDPEGHPAPRLIDAAIPPERAAEYYADLRSQAVKMLMCDLIHGDLSPYNVLLAWNGPAIIDFPQVVGASHNSQAYFFFERDLETLRRFFASIDPSLHAHADDARQIWRAYERRDLTADFVPTKGAVAPLRERVMSPGGPGGPRGPSRGPPGEGRRDAPRGRPDGRAGGPGPRRDRPLEAAATSQTPSQGATASGARQDARDGALSERSDRRMASEPGRVGRNANSPGRADSRGSSEPRRDGRNGNPSGRPGERGPSEPRRDGRSGNPPGRPGERGPSEPRRDVRSGNPPGRPGERGPSEPRRDGRNGNPSARPDQRGPSEPRRDGRNGGGPPSSPRVAYPGAPPATASLQREGPPPPSQPTGRRGGRRGPSQRRGEEKSRLPE